MVYCLLFLAVLIFWCCLARWSGASVSNVCMYINCSLKDWFNNCSCGMLAHCCACWSFVICSASLFASSASGRNLWGWLTTRPSKVWTGVCTYPSRVSVPNMSCISNGWVTVWSCCLWSAVVPRVGWTSCTVIVGVVGASDLVEWVGGNFGL